MKPILFSWFYTELKSQMTISHINKEFQGRYNVHNE